MGRMRSNNRKKPALPRWKQSQPRWKTPCPTPVSAEFYGGRPGSHPTHRRSKRAAGGTISWFRTASEQKGSRRWLLWAFLGILLLALIATGSGLAGYNSAIRSAPTYESTVVAGDAAAQFDLALQDIAAGNYERARQRLEYVIRLDPAFPNAVEQLRAF